MPFLWDPPQKDFRGPGHRDVSSHVPENGVRTWGGQKGSRISSLFLFFLATYPLPRLFFQE